MAAGRPRSWGFWSERKLWILEQYLPKFTTAAKRQSERVYIDALAGEGTGWSRTTQLEFDASAKLALATHPPFTRLIFCEQSRQRAQRLRESLVRAYPERADDFDILEGDCNIEIPAVLRRLRQEGLHWAPTFAFIDPDGMEVGFATLKALADHKLGYRSPSSPRPEYKVELWLLFPTTSIGRTTSADRLRGLLVDEMSATRVFGTTSWQTIRDLRAAGHLTAEEAREEYVNLMRWRLEKTLGYRWTHPLEVRDLRNRPLYHMILATDNEAGTRIMSAIYSKAAAENPALYDQARQESTGAFRLFQVEQPETTSSTRAGYSHRPPLPPLDRTGRRPDTQDGDPS
jgi:three-Cys-motif partner protein